MPLEDQYLLLGSDIVHLEYLLLQIDDQVTVLCLQHDLLPLEEDSDIDLGE
jgi:hypothetical protein